MGARRRLRQTAHKPLSRQQLDYWAGQCCKDSWERVKRDQHSYQQGEEKRQASFWMGVLTGKPLVEPEEGEDEQAA